MKNFRFKVHTPSGGEIIEFPIYFKNGFVSYKFIDLYKQICIINCDNEKSISCHDVNGESDFEELLIELFNNEDWEVSSCDEFMKNYYNLNDRLVSLACSES